MNIDIEANLTVVNTRNACNLLNAIAPCAVTHFKDTALEYLCLQLESMLENHLLDDLDEELLLELDEVVRANQLNCLPFAKSGRAELLLHERHPRLVEDIDEERQRRVKDMSFRVTSKDDDGRLSSSFRPRVGSLEDIVSGSPSQGKTRRKSKTPRNAPFSPSIRPRDSTLDLMFDMEEDDVMAMGSPIQGPSTGPVRSEDLDTTVRKISWGLTEPTSHPGEDPSTLPTTPSGLGIQSPSEAPETSKTWSSPALPSSKLDMREIMAQASSSRTSALSQSISAQKAQDEAIGKQAKLSQKERKKQQQQFLQPQISLNKADDKPASPWQVAGVGQKTSLKDVLNESPSTNTPGLSVRSVGTPTPSKIPSPRRTASPDTRFAGQHRNGGNSSTKKPQTSSSKPSHPTISDYKSSPVIPHSKSYASPPGVAEPALQLSMSDIIGLQRREQEVIKEAVAKRSLQEIQEEQAFQLWWDQESRRAMEEEAARVKGTTSAGKGKGGAGRGKGGARGRWGRGRGDGAPARGRGRGQEKGQEKGVKAEQ